MRVITVPENSDGVIALSADLGANPIEDTITSGYSKSRDVLSTVLSSIADTNKFWLSDNWKGGTLG